MFGEILTDLDTGEEFRSGVDSVRPDEPYAVRLSPNGTGVRATQYVHGKAVSTSDFSSGEKFVESFQISASLVTTWATLMEQNVVEMPPFTGNEFKGDFSEFFVETFLPSFLNDTADYDANVRQMTDYFGVPAGPHLAMKKAPREVKVLVADLLAKQLAFDVPREHIAAFGGMPETFSEWIWGTQAGSAGLSGHTPLNTEATLQPSGPIYSPGATPINPEMVSILLTAGAIIPFFRAWLNVTNARNTRQEDRAWGGETRWSDAYSTYFKYSTALSIGACLVEMSAAYSQFYNCAFYFLPVMALYAKNLLYEHHMRPVERTNAGKLGTLVVTTAGAASVPFAIVLGYAVSTAGSLAQAAVAASWSKLAFTGAIALANGVTGKWLTNSTVGNPMHQAIAAAVMGTLTVLPLYFSEKHPDKISAQEQALTEARLKLKASSIEEFTQLMENDNVLIVRGGGMGLSQIKREDAEALAGFLSGSSNLLGRDLTIPQTMARVNQILLKDFLDRVSDARSADQYAKATKQAALLDALSNRKGAYLEEQSKLLLAAPDPRYPAAPAQHTRRLTSPILQIEAGDVPFQLLRDASGKNVFCAPGDPGNKYKLVPVGKGRLEYYNDDEEVIGVYILAADERTAFRTT